MALKLYSGRNSDIKVYASDWKVFVKELNKLDPQHIKELKKRFREIGGKAREGVVGELKGLGTTGPMKGRKNGMAHGGRTGWGTNYGNTGGPVPNAKRVPYNSVFVKAYNKNKRGATGIAQLQVRSAATVIADLALKPSGRTVTRPYWKRDRFGNPYITTHTITNVGVNAMLSKLGPISKPSKKGKSRNVYPGFDKSYPKVKPEAEQAIQDAIRLIEKNLDKAN